LRAGEGQDRLGGGPEGSVAQRADENFVVHATWAVDLTPGMASRVTPHLVIADSGLRCDTFNFICRARLDAWRASDVAAAAVAYFEERGRPFSWWVGPADEPSDLGGTLEAIGLRRAETELAMALSLGELPGQMPPIPDLEVRRVAGAAELDTFAELSAANWTPPDSNVIAFYRLAAGALLRPDSPQWLYVGYLEGVPVATAEATVAGGAAGLYNISTRPPYRGRGIGSMMTWRPLHQALARGCDLGVLQAAPEGVSIYRRLGFRPFGDITEFKPRSEGPAEEAI
jgi:ribosomal protein S18 acetylase RimI-like enzyme